MNPRMLVLIGGIAVFGYVAYDWVQYRLRLRLRREAKEEGAASRFAFGPKVYGLLAFVVVLALLFVRTITRCDPNTGVCVSNRCPLVAIYVLVVGFWWVLYQARKVAVTERMVINSEVGELVNSFRSVFRIRPTVFSALEEANRKIQPPVGAAVAHAVTTFYVTAMPKRAFDELRQRVQNPYLDQFVYILERGEDAKHDDIMVALEGLLARLRRARELRDHSEVNMTVITGQTRIIQLIAITLVTIVAAVPTLRAAYETPMGQVLFLIIASVGVSTSYIIDRRAVALKERVL
jgi:hypothetical protein